ncbi:MAG: iron-containing alcohol dehydrogenase [Chloroflexota bacterium]|nr:iron-containing alcohol dehydrogenase [Chloroflexota bacterium]
MTVLHPLPPIEITSLNKVQETRPTALITGERSWSVANTELNLPLVVQAEPTRADISYLDNLATNLPEEVEVVYAVGGGLVADVAKYIGWARKLPSVIVPTALTVDGYLTALAAVRKGDSVEYITTGPASKLVIDWEVIRSAPRYLRGAAVLELLTMVTGLLDWRYAAERNKTTPETRFVPWAAGLAAGIAQQAFKIAAGCGQGNVEALQNLLDLLCMEVTLTNLLGHNRPQEGSEQHFAYAMEQRLGKSDSLPYSDLVGPGILIAAALHNQDVAPIRSTLQSAGVRLGELHPDDIVDTLMSLPEFVRRHNLPYTILNDLELSTERARELLATTGLDSAVGR